jgi:hypothetical protein
MRSHARPARYTGGGALAAFGGALACALACALAVAVGLSARADGASPNPPSILCSPGGGRTLSRSHQVRVFARKGRFYSCWLPTRRRTTLGYLGEPVPDGPPVLTTHVRIDGEFVAFAELQTGDPDFSLSSIISVNARTGHVGRDVEPHETEYFDSSVVDVGVAADDALVYVQREGTPCPGLHMSGEHGPDDAVIAVEPGVRAHTLDCEVPSDPEASISMLVVKGQTATWIHSGVLHTATLR